MRTKEDIAADLTHRVRTHELPPGKRIPAYIDLANEYGVTGPEMKGIVASLVKDGVIEDQDGWLATPQSTRQKIADILLMTVNIDRNWGEPLIDAGSVNEAIDALVDAGYLKLGTEEHECEGGDR